MDDRHAQFVVIVAELSRAAATARLPVTIELAEGRLLRGLPQVTSASGTRDEVDDTGVASTAQVDGHSFALDEVVACSIAAPTDD